MVNRNARVGPSQAILPTARDAYLPLLFALSQEQSIRTRTRWPLTFARGARNTPGSLVADGCPALAGTLPPDASAMLWAYRRWRIRRLRFDTWSLKAVHESNHSWRRTVHPSRREPCSSAAGMRAGGLASLPVHRPQLATPAPPKKGPGPAPLTREGCSCTWGVLARTFPAEEHALVADYFGAASSPEKIKAVFPDQAKHQAFIGKMYQASNASTKRRECAP
jgi:hypothetical protein